MWERKKIRRKPNMINLSLELAWQNPIRSSNIGESVQRGGGRKRAGEGGVNSLGSWA